MFVTEESQLTRAIQEADAYLKPLLSADADNLDYTEQRDAVLSAHVLLTFALLGKEPTDVNKASS